jgi:hypothetical protein
MPKCERCNEVFSGICYQKFCDDCILKIERENDDFKNESIDPCYYFTDDSGDTI